MHLRKLLLSLSALAASSSHLHPVVASPTAPDSRAIHNHGHGHSTASASRPHAAAPLGIDLIEERVNEVRHEAVMAAHAGVERGVVGGVSEDVAVAKALEFAFSKVSVCGFAPHKGPAQADRFLCCNQLSPTIPRAFVEASGASLVVTDAHRSDHTGITHVYLVQTMGGIEVANAVATVNVGPQGDIVSFSSTLLDILPEEEPTNQGGVAAESVAVGDPGWSWKSRLAKVDHGEDGDDESLVFQEAGSRDVGGPAGNSDFSIPKRRQRRETSSATSASQPGENPPRRPFLSISPTEAVTILFRHLGLPAPPPTALAINTASTVPFHGPADRTRPDYIVRNVTDADSADVVVSDPTVKLKLVRLPYERHLLPVWEVELELKDHHFNAWVQAAAAPLGAAVDGSKVGVALSDEDLKVINLVDWVADASYTVFPLGVNDPEEGGRVRITDPFHPLASPEGWHFERKRQMVDLPNADFKSSETVGINAFAQENLDGKTGSGWIKKKRPDGGRNQNFDFPLNLKPSKYLDASVTNLFYWTNALHDLFYAYGFTEKSGNFQEDNHGRGGKEGDGVIANAQDGSGYNNANFATPPDGRRPKMRMYVWDVADPYRDGDLEGGIITHEYTHGVSIRLTGGPSNSGCLGWGEAGGMGEGWGDLVATILRTRAKSTRKDSFGMGEYSNDGKGIRKYKYSTSMKENPSTYKFISKPGYWGVHAKGEVWAEMLYEVYWNLVDELGFNPDWFDTPLVAKSLTAQPHLTALFPYNHTTHYRDFATGEIHPRPAAAATEQPAKRWTRGGNVLLLQLVMDGLKFQPCNPTFVDSRDAILLAEKVLTGGKHACAIWRAFAKRGLGEGARPGGREDAQVPDECREGRAGPEN
ncbi:Fungalysin/Thermolysin Extracellular metalloproteinase 5 [Phlyctochytrium bullatum]|nr:Fungalysin/Thermolysin Extracellular metalloproteinase 5 [Phlyctochytrium bullatum]